MILLTRTTGNTSGDIDNDCEADNNRHYRLFVGISIMMVMMIKIKLVAVKMKYSWYS